MNFIKNQHKILMLGWEYSPIIAGGLGVVARSITTHLSNNYNQKIYYVLPKLPDNVNLNSPGIDILSAEVNKYKKNHIDVEFTEIESNLISPYSDPNTISFYSELLDVDGSDDKSIYGKNLMKEVEIYAQKVPEKIKKKNFDLIHSHDWMTTTAATNVKKITKKPLIMHIHATEMERTLGNPNPYIFEKELRGMESADAIIAVSQITKERIVQNYGISPDKIKVVHNAVEKVEKKYGPISKNIYKNEKIVLFLARLTAMKGANYLLEAAKEVIKTDPNVKFVFVGGGELLEDLIEQSVRLGIANKVTFTGFLTHDQVDMAYQKANVFIMPSVAEPFGITPLEAIKNGTPVIISKQSGVSEVLQNVLKVDFWDTQEMANKILAILKYGVLAEELTNHSKRDLEKISWTAQSAKILEVYNEIKQNNS